jgi:plasmid maintenance system killer protein
MAYQLFSENPNHPSLRLKKLQGSDRIWSVRITEQYRAVGVRFDDTIEWIWIGTHNEFDNLFS